MSQDRLLERFLRYAAVDTTSVDGADSYPSSPGQLLLGAMLLKELRKLGLADATQNEHGLVLATVPGNSPGGASKEKENIPTICFNAHLDTSPEVAGAHVKAQVVRDYDGRDLVLPNDQTQIIRVSDNPELELLTGKTIITTDGTTLLGADDKAGVAVIMEAATRLIQSRIEHGPIRVLFTCDEEIGHGVDHVDVSGLDAVACYTLDGPGAGQIDIETFSADLAVITVHGVNIHPSIAKDRMVNAVRVASDLVVRYPREMAPETTDEREGFSHPYTIQGGVDQVTIRCLLRDFDTANLADQAGMLSRIAASVETAWPGSRIEVDVRPQYRNLGDGLKREPRAVAFAEEAFRRLQIEPKRSIIRGGTDGSRLTELGLPTPNLSTGQHNPHSRLEWACLEEMETACQVLIELARVWAGRC